MGLCEASVYRVGGYRPLSSAVTWTNMVYRFSSPLRMRPNLERLERGEINFWATDAAKAHEVMQTRPGSLRTALSFGDDLYLALHVETSDELQRLQKALAR